MSSCLRWLAQRFESVLDGDTKPMSASQKCEFLAIMFQRKQGALKGLFCVVFILQIGFLLFLNETSGPPIYLKSVRIIFWTRLGVVFFTALLLALLLCKPVNQEEQKFMHSVLFDHYLERSGNGSQCHAILECFDAHKNANPCKSQFTDREMTFMKIMCLSSALHGDKSTISSPRTRGLMMLMFLRLWPASSQENEVILNVRKSMLSFGLRDRVLIYARVTANTSIMELAAWIGLMLYAHTLLSDGAVTATWNGVYDEMLRYSNFSSWNVSRGQDPRYTKDLLYLMTDSLLACLAFCSMFPIPFSAFLILLLPMTLIIQVSFMTLPEIVQAHQLNPTYIGQSQLYLLVSFYVLQRHNLFLLRNYRHDYLMSFPQRLSHLPQGLGNAPSNAARDRMVALVGNILTQMTSVTTSHGASSGEEVPLDSAQGALLLNQPDAVASSGCAAASQSSAEHKDACSAISTLLSYLKDDSSALSQPCDISDICIEAINQCQPLLKHRQVDMRFAGRRSVLPLRVLFVDDNEFVIKFLERLARNRGYYYESCLDGESCVKVFEATLQIESNACDRFDLIVMDKEMPTKEAGGFRTAGVTAVKKLRELCKLYAEQEPGFKYPCIMGNTTCQDEDDATVIEFRSELERMRQQAGMATTALMVKGKMDSWTEEFDADVRRLCCLSDTVESDAYRLPTVWGTPIRLQMLFRNLITNAIHHGKPSVGNHCVSVSYDIIDSRSRVHPCLLRRNQDDELTRSLSWQIEGKFEAHAQRFVQVTVTDNGPGIDTQKMKQNIGQVVSHSGSPATQATSRSVTTSPAPISDVANFGICLKSIVCPEIANSHGAMGVHSRIEPMSGCSFVVALPLYRDPAVPAPKL